MYYLLVFNVLYFISVTDFLLLVVLVLDLYIYFKMSIVFIHFFVSFSYLILFQLMFNSFQILKMFLIIVVTLMSRGFLTKATYTKASWVVDFSQTVSSVSSGVSCCTSSVTL